MDKPNDTESKLTDDLTVDDNYDGTEYLGHEVETYLMIDQLTGRDKLHLPLLYDAVLDNLDIATPEQVVILLKAMGRPSDTPRKRDRRTLKAALANALAFVQLKHTIIDKKTGLLILDKETGQPLQKLPLMFDSNKQVMLSFFKALKPSNPTERFYKQKYENGYTSSLNTLNTNPFGELYSAAWNLLNETKT